MICYGCGRSLSNDPSLSNFGKWSIGDIDGERRPYCACDAWCESYTLAADAGEHHSGFSDQQRQHVRAQVDPWFGEHECDSRCWWMEVATR